MNRTLTCIICPNGCELEIAYEGDQILSVTGNKCPKGAEYAEQEIKNPMRTIASSVKLTNGTMPLVSVRVNGPIPKAKIMDVMAVISETSVDAPVKIGDVVIADVLGLGVDVVATRNVGRRS
ncbi:MAG: DUF1667 domain-containing protein [Lachnospiraceae bacterium]|jgi:CxxC motif-containing protein|nr:DUF1667 domain-containing protein [Lachnospiraceae bacterium]MBQ2251161.1 DUF1667 domain-containing protein [Lachnospiraceae bacterium]MBQ5599693.1 DUF1667 domain-containing protein [Lachnospiraceae bacterium]MBQ5915921.1 DUF1667 domain-containing protein [Lachnospiraceae bacterium]